MVQEFQFAFHPGGGVDENKANNGSGNFNGGIHGVGDSGIWSGNGAADHPE